VRAARQVYGRNWLAVLPIGLTAIPIIGGIGGIGNLTGSGTLHPSLTIGSFHLEIQFSLEEIARLLASTVVVGAVISTLKLRDEGQRATFVTSYRLALSRFWRLVGVTILFNVVLIALLITVIGIPIAVLKYVDWQFAPQEVVFENKRVRDAFRGSTRVVRNHWWRTLLIAGFFELISVAIGPVLGFFLIFANFSLTWVNIVGSLAFAVLVPYVAIGRTLLYLDLQVRHEGADEAAPRWRRWLWDPFRRWRARRRSRPAPQPRPGGALDIP
jgi:hypothetical protein